MRRCVIVSLQNRALLDELRALVSSLHDSGAFVALREDFATDTVLVLVRHDSLPACPDGCEPQRWTVDGLALHFVQGGRARRAMDLSRAHQG